MRRRSSPSSSSRPAIKAVLGIIFEGEISQARKGKEPNGTDTYLDVLAMSGYQAYGYSTISKTLSAGATVDDVISTIADSMKKHNLSIGHLAKLGGEKFSRAVVLHGMSRDQMRKYTQGAGASWSVQNQKIFVVKNGKPVPGMERELNASSGLIGIPEQTMQGIVAKILIDPGFAVHQHVRIDPKININEALAPISPLAQFGKTSNIPFRTEIPKVRKPATTPSCASTTTASWKPGLGTRRSPWCRKAINPKAQLMRAPPPWTPTPLVRSVASKILATPRRRQV